MPNKLLENTVEKVKEKKAERRLKWKARRAQKNRDKQKRRKRIERNEPEGATEKAQATVYQSRRLAGELGVTTDKAKSAASTAGSAAEGLGSAFAPPGASSRSPRPESSESGSESRTVDVLFSHDDDKWLVREDNGRKVSTHRSKSAAITRAERKERKSNTFGGVSVRDKPPRRGGMMTPPPSGFDQSSSSSEPSSGGFPSLFGESNGQDESTPFPPRDLPDPGSPDAGGPFEIRSSANPRTPGGLPDPGSPDTGGPFEIKSSVNPPNPFAPDD